MAEVRVRYKNELRDVNGYICTACEEIFVTVGLPNYCPECGEEIKGEANA